MNREQGSALSSIIVIVFVLLLGGIYFLISTKEELTERNSLEQKASVIDSIQE